MPKLRPVIPRKFSIGGWCLVNKGADPFGGPVRDLSLEQGLAACKQAGIEFVSFHDADLWPDDASQATVKRRINEVKRLLEKHGRKILNFTTNLFSNSCFRSGAFSSPFPEVRKAAIIKATRSMDYANDFGARNIIFWGGREGSDGALEQDTGVGLRNYMLGIRVCMDYAIAKGYEFDFTIEPKVYEPRLLGLYAGTGASAASAIKHFFAGSRYRGRIKVNPEYPQHVGMLCLDPNFELGQLLEEDMLAQFIHFGGQIPGRMDCDLPPGIGGSLYTDFMICLRLERRGWPGVIELDCRPMRTTTTPEGMALFLKWCVAYWRELEERVRIYGRDPIIAKMLKEFRGEDDHLIRILSDSLNSAEAIRDAVRRLHLEFSQSKKGFAGAAEINTDVVEAYAYRVLQIVMGAHKQGAEIFKGTRWSA